MLLLIKTFKVVVCVIFHKKKYKYPEQQFNFDETRQQFNNFHVKHNTFSKILMTAS